jgi:hypothetical protein
MMAVVFAVIKDVRRREVACSEFRMFVDCLLIKMVDQEACDFLKAQMDVRVEPEDRPVQFCHHRLTEGRSAAHGGPREGCLFEFRAEVGTGGEEELAGEREATPRRAEGEGRGATGQAESVK